MNPRSSIPRRALVAGSVLVAFYLTTALIALLLLPLPVLAALYGDHTPFIGILLMAAAAWGASYGLLRGLLGARPATFVAPGRRLQRADAPELFAMLSRLAEVAATEPPEHVYLSLGTELFVVETGAGFLGRRSERVMCIGAGILHHTPKAEVRSMLAHELGHLAHGHTRYTGLIAFTTGAFASVLHSTHRAAPSRSFYGQVAAETSKAIGSWLVRGFGTLYLKLSRPDSRANELAADRLAARIAGRETAIAALQGIAVLDPLYEAYLQGELVTVVSAGFIPTDLAEGFERFRARMEARGKVGQLVEAAHRRATDPFDTHPALAERIGMLRQLHEAHSPIEQSTSASSLLAESFGFEAWYARALAALIVPDRKAPLVSLPWSALDREVHLPNHRAVAQALVAVLAPRFPRARTHAALFHALLGELAANRLYELANVLEPRFQRVVLAERHQVATRLAVLAITTTFSGALLDRGATLIESLGESCQLFMLHGEEVRPGDLALALPTDAEAGRQLAGWAERLLAA